MSTITPKIAMESLYKKENVLTSQGKHIISNALILWEEDRKEVNRLRRDNDSIKKAIRNFMSQGADISGHEALIGWLESTTNFEEDTLKNIETGAVNHPEHYNAGDIECIDAIDAATKHLNGDEGFCTGSAIKYLWRWKLKNGVEDLQKAKWYIDRLIDSQQE